MRSLLKFSVDNPVLINLLMIGLIGLGIYSSLVITREMFPEFRPNEIQIATVYPGATPTEIEKGITIKIEEEVREIDGVDTYESQIVEGISTVRVELLESVEDISVALNDVKGAVDAIQDLPEDAEETRVFEFKPRLPVIGVSLYGNINEKELKRLGKKLRDDVLELPGITDVTLSGTRKDEVIVQVHPDKLMKYHLSFPLITAAIKRANLDLPGGVVKTAGADVAVRTLGERDRAEEIAEITVASDPLGRVVYLNQVADVVDGFEDSERKGRFNGEPAVTVMAYKTPDQDAIDISNKIKAFLAGKAHQPIEWDWHMRLQNLFGKEHELQRIYASAYADPWPAYAKAQIHTNLAKMIEDRLELLRRNGAFGLAFVFVSLLLFLNWRIAVWIATGLIVSIFGTILFLHQIGSTLSMISMFGLIVVLGLIVDDAIVIGENVFTKVEEGMSPREAAIEGGTEVAWPVVATVATTVAAFLPLAMIEGEIGHFMAIMPVVVTCALSVSLLEALVILPSHLAEFLKPMKRAGDGSPVMKRQSLIDRLVNPIRHAQYVLIQRIMLGAYEKFLRLAVGYRYVTIAGAFALLFIALGMVGGGRVENTFFSSMDSETVLVNLDMPVGTPIEDTERMLDRLEKMAIDLPETRSTQVLIGSALNMANASIGASQSHVGQIIIELAEVGKRDRTSDAILAELREKSANLTGIDRLQFSAMQGGPGGDVVKIEVSGDDFEKVIPVVEALKKRLADYEGIHDINDDYDAGRPEAQIELLESGRSLGLTTQDLAVQVRGAFYGLEAKVLVRDREDVKIMVRYPEAQRKRIYDLEEMRIATPTGQLVPFKEVAKFSMGTGYATIRRTDGHRVINVSADANQDLINPDDVVEELVKEFPAIEAANPGVKIEAKGRRREMIRSMNSLALAMIVALVIIYIILAWLFRSYVQPVIVMTSLPLAMIGVIFGHWVMGYDLTIVSKIGFVALAGIAVNDALVLIDFINKRRAEGMDAFEAVVYGGKRRLRAIMLTTLTTVLGLAPLVLETSFQAKFLIPMAVTICFGLMFATVLTLLVIPSLYMIQDDVVRLAARLWYGPAGKPVLA
ncbi:MAG: efflux RND transporter permease subunit [Phycisphaerae bacterium]|nr:efflux RND transporter permease subunit [Phycisphaerae bacterium]